MSKAYVQEDEEAFTPIKLVIEFDNQEDVNNLYWLCNSSLTGLEVMDKNRTKANGGTIKVYEELASVQKTSRIVREALAGY